MMEASTRLGRNSLRWRLSAIVAALLVTVLIVFLSAAYYQVRATLVRSGGERAQAAADQLASLFAQGAQQRLTELRTVAADPVLWIFLAARDSETENLAMSRLQATVASGPQTIELWDDAGERLLSVAGRPDATRVLPPIERPSAAGYGPFRTVGGVMFSDVVVEVPRGGTASDTRANTPAGYLVVRRSSSSVGASDLLGRLMGTGAAVSMGNQAGDVWSDLSKTVPTPVDPKTAGISEIKDARGERRVGALAQVRGTPWAVWVDFPHASIISPALGFLARMILILVLVVGVSVVSTAILTRRITTPLTDVTAAAEAIAAGDYSQRVGIERRDEIGRLGEAFNTMTDRVQTAHEQLAAHASELEASEARKSAIMEAALDGVVTMDQDGLITTFNAAAERTFGYSRAEAIGRPLADLLVPSTFRDRHRQGLARYVTTGEGPVLGKRLELPALRKDGSEFPAELSIVVVKRHGPPLFTGFIRDVSDQVAAQEAKLRTVRLEEENKRVQEATRLKSEFLANMSHELRTPLNAIIGFAELLHDGEVEPESPQFKEFLYDILTSGQHLLRLINDILDLSKVEAGKLEFRPEELDVEQVVREVVDILRTTAASKHVRIVTDIAPDIREGVLDRGRLKQVLYNYVSNALKFTPEGGMVTIRAKPEKNDRFRLEVEDTGIGIAAHDLSRLFVEFQQLAAGTAKAHAGTGLGLALTRRLVEAQGGSVGVASEVGHGSAFWAVLPRHAGVIESPLEPRLFPAKRSDAPRILVIEDDARDQEVLVRTLTEAGFSVQTAITGTQALDRLQCETFDAVTLDLLLPDMTGVDVLKAIRRLEQHDDVPVIVVTVVTERGAVSGFAVHDVFSKPLQSDELLRSLGRAGVVAQAGKKVLVVDDDPGSLRLMAATLERAGFESLCVKNGQAGLDEAAQSTPLLVVLDLMMPEMNGFQFLERFRRLPNCETTPVLVWSVKDLSRDEVDTLKHSVQGILPKSRGEAVSVVDELRHFLPTGLSA